MELFYGIAEKVEKRMAKIKNIEQYIEIIKKFYDTEGCGAINKIFYRG